LTSMATGMVAVLPASCTQFAHFNSTSYYAMLLSSTDHAANAGWRLPRDSAHLASERAFERRDFRPPQSPELLPLTSRPDPHFPQCQLLEDVLAENPRFHLCRVFAFLPVG